jgi:hypothetical protein
MPDGDGQQVAFIKLQKWLRVSHPINSAEDYVLAPLSSITGQPTLQAAIVTYRSAGAEGEGGLDDRLHQTPRSARRARSRCRQGISVPCR